MVLQSIKIIPYAFVAVYNAYFALEVSTNKTELASLIAAVNYTLENTSEGQWKGQYPAGSKDVLRAVLVPAEDINNDRLATEEGVAGAYNNLKEAYDIYLSQASEEARPWTTIHEVSETGTSTVDLIGWMDPTETYDWGVSNECTYSTSG